MTDSRHHTRIAAALPIEFGGAGRATQARCLNISGQGMFIATWTPLPEGDDLWLRFSLPGDSTVIYIRGRVVWTKYDARMSPCGMGIEFVRMPHDHRRKIIDFVEKKTAERPAA